MKQCRFCLEEESDEGKLIRPCLCSGTIMYVHVCCFYSWIDKSKNPQAKIQCIACKHRYSFTTTNIETLRYILVIFFSISVLYALLWAVVQMRIFGIETNFGREAVICDMLNSWIHCSNDWIAAIMALGLVGLGPLSIAADFFFELSRELKTISELTEDLILMAQGIIMVVGVLRIWTWVFRGFNWFLPRGHRGRRVLSVN